MQRAVPDRRKGVDARNPTASIPYHPLSSKWPTLILTLSQTINLKKFYWNGQWQHNLCQKEDKWMSWYFGSCTRKWNMALFKISISTYYMDCPDSKLLLMFHHVHTSDVCGIFLHVVWPYVFFLVNFGHITHSSKPCIRKAVLFVINKTALLIVPLDTPVCLYCLVEASRDRLDVVLSWSRKVFFSPLVCMLSFLLQV